MMQKANNNFYVNQNRQQVIVLARLVQARIRSDEILDKLQQHIHRVSKLSEPHLNNSRDSCKGRAEIEIYLQI